MKLPYHYVWLWWSSGFLAFWGVIYTRHLDLRVKMLGASLLTMPFGLTEPLFVPRYWNPPSLFDLAQRTGFDLESFIFSFAIGGLGVVLYDLAFKVRDRPMAERARHRRNHLIHFLALLLPFLVFATLLLRTSWNPIYCVVIAMSAGALAVMIGRPDLAKPIWVGALLFLGLYVLFFLPLCLVFPGYVRQVWNLARLSGILILGIPLEEYLFAYAFGLYWSSAYEFIYWLRRARAEAQGS